MRYKSLRIAIIAGMVVKIGQEIELNEKAAKPYIEAGFIEEINEDTLAEQTEPEVKQEDTPGEQTEPEVKQEDTPGEQTEPEVKQEEKKKGK